jgi:hypothetical protein
MHTRTTWMPIAAMGLTVAIAGTVGLGCDTINCGTGTIERNGTCQPADDQPGSAQCGAGTELGAGGKCVPTEVVVCDLASTREQVDPDTGVITCIGTGGTSCDTELPCPAPAAGKNTLCGRLYDAQTDEPIAATSATGTPCNPTAPTATGPCSLKLQFFDALDFSTAPTTSTPLTVRMLTVDDCGRYAALDVAESGSTFTGIAVDDATGTGDRYKLTGVALSDAEANPARKFRAYGTRNETDTAWSTTAALGGASFASRGVIMTAFRYHDAPVAGVMVRRDGQVVGADDYYFSDPGITRSTVDPARTTTGPNGSSLLINSGLISHDGAGATPSGCQWPSNLAAAILNVVFVQVKEPRTPGGVVCP